MADADRGLPLQLCALIAALVLAATAGTMCTDNGDDDDGNGGDEPPESPGWTDMDEFEKLLSNLDNYDYFRGDAPEDIENLPDRGDTLIIFLGADRVITGREETAFNEVVELGGTGLMACDNTYGDVVAQHYGLTLDPHRIISTDAEVNWSFIPSDAELGGQSYHLLFNNPLAIFSDNDGSHSAAASVGFSSSGTPGGEQEASAADMNDNNVIDAGDVQGPISMLEVVPGGAGGEGTFVLCSDTGIFNDDFIDRHDNGAFISDFIRYVLPSGGDIMLYAGAQTATISPNILYGD